MIADVAILSEKRNQQPQQEMGLLPSASVYNEEAEQALLGALLLNNRSFEDVHEILLPEHFAIGVNGEIYQALSTIIDRGQVADPITLKNFFENTETLKAVGGTAYLVQLAESVVSIVNVMDYARLIYELHLRRQLIGIGEAIVLDAKKPDLDSSAPQQIENAEKNLYNLATHGQTRSGFVPFSDSLSEAIQSAESAFKRDSHVVGVSTGLLDLDKRLGGLHNSDLLILAGRPSMGKTALVTNIAFNAACLHAEKEGEGASVAFFSLEMSAEQLATRILASESGVSSDRIRRGEIRSEDFPNFVEISRKLQSLPLYIDDTPALTVSSLRNRARRLQRQKGLGLIIIDYLQLLEGGLRGRSDNRVQEISEITRGLKTLAKELNIPVIALSQLSRAVEQRDDKRPQLSDLRDSGTIEQDSDVVMFIFREAYYEARREPPEGSEKHLQWQKRMDEIHNKTEVIISKQRHGPIGTIPLYFDGALTKFGNYRKADS